jgi:transposase
MFIRPLDADERRRIQAGLHASDAFVLRRCQILLASARGERAPTIGRQLGCNGQTVRNVINGFNAQGLAVLQAGSSRPHRLRTAFSDENAARLAELLHHSPREFGREQTFWTLDTAAQVSFEQGLITAPTSIESVRRALQRLGRNWHRAKHWITSPDPQYAVKKRPESA